MKNVREIDSFPHFANRRSTQLTLRYPPLHDVYRCTLSLFTNSHYKNSGITNTATVRRTMLSSPAPQGNTTAYLRSVGAQHKNRPRTLPQMQ